MVRATDKPIDGGWAWVQVLGAGICNFFVVGAFKSLGILFVEFRSKFGASSALTALMMGITSGGMSLLAPATNNLARKYSSRKCVMAGGCLLGISTFLAAFAPNIYYVIVVFGVFTGISYSFLYGPSLMMVGYYFENRRSTANGLAVAGSSLGQLAIPQLIVYLLKEYTLRGTLIIYSAVALHTVAAGALLTPMSFYDRDERRRKREAKLKVVGDAEDEEEGEGKGVKEQLNGKGKGKYVGASNHQGSGDVGMDNADTHHPGPVNGKSNNSHQEALLENHQELEKEAAEKHTGMMLKKVDDHYTSQNSLYLAEHQTVPEECVKLEQELHAADKSKEREGEKERESERESEKNCCVRFLRSAWSLYEWSLFRRSLFVIYVVTICLGNCGYVNVLLFLPPHSKDLGIAEDRAAMLLSIAGVSDLFGRVFGGVFADMGIIKRSTFMASTILFTGITAIVSTFSPTFASLVTLCVIMGLIGGFYMSMMAVVLVDFVGLEKFPSALGLTIMCMGFTNCGTPTMLGMIRDQTGSYNGSFWVCGVMMILAGISLLLEPLARKLDHRNNQPPPEPTAQA